MLTSFLRTLERDRKRPSAAATWRTRLASRRALSSGGGSGSRQLAPSGGAAAVSAEPRTRVITESTWHAPQLEAPSGGGHTRPDNFSRGEILCPVENLKSLALADVKF